MGIYKKERKLKVKSFFKLNTLLTPVNGLLVYPLIASL